MIQVTFTDFPLWELFYFASIVQSPSYQLGKAVKTNEEKITKLVVQTEAIFPFS